MDGHELGTREARRHRYETLAKDGSFDEKAAAVLELGKQYLGVDNAHLTMIHPETDYCEVTVTTDSPDGQFPPGPELGLETTYCRHTIATDEPFTLHDASEQGWEDDPAHDAHGLDCYCGTTLTVGDERYRTVCFVAEEARKEPFSDAETMFAELVASVLGRELERKHHDWRLTRQRNLVKIFSRVLRHNIRNGMTVIRGRVRRVTDQLQRNTSDAVTIEKIDDLLDLSRKARDLKKIIERDAERKRTDVRRLVELAISDVSAEFPAAAISLDGDEDATAAVLPSIDRALHELMENAAKHGGETPTIEVTIRTVSRRVEIRITDDGPGLSEQEREVLETGAETPLTHGSSLGLWLVRWIVNNHDGTVAATVGDE